MKIKIAILLLLFPIVCNAAPSQPSDPGNIVHGSSYTVTGTSFGTKSPAAPAVYDKVEYSLSNGQLIPTGGSNLWPGTSGDYNNVYYKTTNPRGKQTPHYSNQWANHNIPSALDGLVVAGADSAQKLYISYWMYPTSDPHTDVNAVTNGQNKFIRVMSGGWDVAGEGGIIWAPNVLHNFSFTTGGSGGAYVDWGGTPGAWNRMEMWIDSDTTINPTYSAYTNNQHIATYSASSNQAWNVDILGSLGADWDNEATPSFIEPTLDWGEIYADNTRARIEICNNSVKANATHCEIQIPSAWSTTSAEFTANQGSFANGTAYLFIIDPAGDASPGREITFADTEGGDTTAPTITAFTMPATATSTTVSVSSFTATDATGVTGYCITTVNSSAGCSWPGSAPSTATGAAGANTFYAWARDAALNVSAASTDTTTITLPSYGNAGLSGSGNAGLGGAAAATIH